MKQLLLAIFTILVCACSTCKVSTQNQISEIKFGRGGGFTNQKVLYSLNLKGELSRDGKIVNKISCGEVEKVFGMADAVVFSINEPDNFYWFIDIKGKKPVKLVWNGSSQVYDEVKNLYNELNTLVK